jgi:NAD(P)-dependent dehydrogenase (short-subunit alcohol dehydrogenase family)
MPSDLKHVAVIGANGAIGKAFVDYFLKQSDLQQLFAGARSPQIYSDQRVHSLTVDLLDESSIEQAAEQASKTGPLSLIIVATGLLHAPDIKPEKSLKDVKLESLRTLFDVNTIGPLLIAKHFLPLLDRKADGIFAALSARVGSISDNRLGGWYGYRASKAALNMMIKTLAIEWARQAKSLIVVGLHPGTTDSELSKPFQAQVQRDKLFTPDHAVTLMMDVLKQLKPEDSGKCFAYDGVEVMP